MIMYLSIYIYVNIRICIYICVYSVYHILYIEIPLHSYYIPFWSVLEGEAYGTLWDPKPWDDNLELEPEKAQVATSCNR